MRSEEQSRGGGCSPSPLDCKGFSGFEELVLAGCSLKVLGMGLAWMMVHGEARMRDGDSMSPLMMVFGGQVFKEAGLTAVLRSREVLPLRLGDTCLVSDALLRSSFSEAVVDEFVELWHRKAWLYLTIRFLNFLHGCRAALPGRWRATERVAVVSLEGCIERTLSHDTSLQRTVFEVEKELSDRFLNYTGEEVPKMEPLSFAQAVVALPPKDRGGSIDVLDWVDGRTKTFLENPANCVLGEEETPEIKLQAKVHVKEADRMEFCMELVERKICDWVESSDVFEYRNQKVLNGMFGVRKDAVISDGRPVLRTIMNLIPSNSAMLQLQGLVSELPGMSQYLSLTLEDGESFSLYQSDMTSAFYLFRLPAVWQRFLCFNICFDGADIGKVRGRKYYLAAAVLPMGWGSAVAVMQEVSTNLLLKSGLDSERQVRRQSPLPPWLVSAVKEGKEQRRSWWHVYLDNFFAGEKVMKGSAAVEGHILHNDAEAAWSAGGVVTSEKKRVAGASAVQELGAVLDGDSQFLGMSGERLVKLCQTTLLVLSKRYLSRKWLQVICGRWIHVLQYRRAGMSVLHEVWSVISGKAKGLKQGLQARRELLWCIMGLCLFHASLGAVVSEITTVSDASNKGGAFGCSEGLTPSGRSFCRAMMDPSPGRIKVPIIVLSLFNGIGGAFRCYDILGVEVEALIGFDTHKPSNRVCSRRWPHAALFEDVRSIDKAFLRKILFKYPHAIAIHLWAGFPCVDLSSVKAGRANLQGPESSLFFEILRVMKLLVEIFGTDFPIHCFVENVASMDKSAAKQISDFLGTKPYKVQCSTAVPVSRPRFCWTDIKVPNLPGITLKPGDGFTEIVAAAPWPATSQWIDPNFTWPSDDRVTVFPTCMKSIARAQPPPKPAGLDRCDRDTCLRWRADKFKFPPYQYKSQYVLYSENSWRLLDAQERELLHGYGFDHTAVCLSASDIKQGKERYEDLRCSLIGDSFSIYSFVIFAWAALYSKLPPVGYWHLAARMGMAPGFCCPLQFACPISRSLVFG